MIAQELQGPHFMTPDEAKTLLTGNFGKELHKAACAYCHPLFWALRGDNGLLKITANGTAFVLDCGKRPFLVTAAHVYEEYVSDLEKFGEHVFGSLGSIPFRMEKRLIACLGSKPLDVATFEITSEEIAESGKNVLVGGQKSWPPDPVKEGEGVLFAGFPGTERIEEQTELDADRLQLELQAIGRLERRIVDQGREHVERFDRAIVLIEVARERGAEAHALPSFAGACERALTVAHCERPVALRRRGPREPVPAPREARIALDRLLEPTRARGALEPQRSACP